jgi:hypothetical protein
MNLGIYKYLGILVRACTCLYLRRDLQEILYLGGMIQTKTINLQLYGWQFSDVHVFD